jgi:hypothetical protein
MPKLVRLYIVSIVTGIGLAVAFTLMLLWGNVGNLRHLVLAVPGGWIAGAMLVAANAVVFSGVQFAIAVMSLAEGDGRGPGRGLLARVPVVVRSARRVTGRAR